MADPLRRRVRARLLGGLVRSAPPLLARPGLRALEAWARRSRYARAAEENLLLAYGDTLEAQERTRIARATFRHAGRQLENWLRLARGAPPDGPRRARGAWIDAAVRFDDTLAILDDALAEGRGAIVVTAHLGDWELACAALRRRGIRGAVVGHRKPRDPLAERWIEMRRGYGVETIPQDAGPRRLLEVLDGGATLGLLTDLEVRRLAGVFAPFFGRPAWTMAAPAALARVRAQPLLPMRCVRTAAGDWRLSFDPPLAYREELPREAATLDLATRLNAVYESWIRVDPEQWAWYQPRWRRTPDDDPTPPPA